MGKCPAGTDQLAHFLFFSDEVTGFGLCNVFAADTDVQQFPMAGELFVLGEEEGEFGHLDAQCQIGLDDVLTDIV